MGTDDGTFPLQTEHEALGGSFARDDEAVPVRSYGDENAEEHAFSAMGEAALVDLTGMLAALIAGPSAHVMAASVCAAEPPPVGTMSFSAVLTGDGAVVSVPLLMRTGTSEYVALDVTPRSDALFAWLSFVGNIEQDGYAPYAQTSLIDATDVHVPLLLAGEVASAVLGSYVGDMADLPQVGEVRALTLDGRFEAIGANVAAYDTTCEPAYLLLVAPAHARVLWRSLLSFPSVVPAGRRALFSHLKRRLPWFGQTAGTSDRLEIPGERLRNWNLARTGGFIGGRALS